MSYKATVYEMGAQYPDLFAKFHEAAMERNRLRAINAELLAALKDCVLRLKAVDTRLLKVTGAEFEYELGEVIRARAAIERATP